MESMNFGRSTSKYKISEEEVLAATHGLAIVLTHYEAGNGRTIREIAKDDTFYGMRPGSLFTELLTGCGMYAAEPFRRLLQSYYGEKAVEQYTPEVQRIIDYLSKVRPAQE